MIYVTSSVLIAEGVQTNAGLTLQALGLFGVEHVNVSEWAQRLGLVFIEWDEGSFCNACIRRNT